jgi:hypothetical protein
MIHHDLRSLAPILAIMFFIHVTSSWGSVHQEDIRHHLDTGEDKPCQSKVSNKQAIPKDNLSPEELYIRGKQCLDVDDFKEAHGYFQ